MATVKCLKADVSGVSPLSFARNVSFETLYGDQFTLSTQLIKPDYLDILPHRHNTTVSLEMNCPYSTSHMEFVLMVITNP